MTFQDFATSFGLILGPVEIGRWVSVPTVDHPHKRNGRYKYLGDRGWVQNWAQMSEPQMWRGESSEPGEFRRIAARVEADRKRAAERAARKAAWIMHQTQKAPHPYLSKKGFPLEPGPVWNGLLCVPMRIDDRLVGCQLITEQGEKRFLQGQITKGATLTFDAGGIDIFCEGFATALSIRAALKAIKFRYQIHVCFSAGNLQLVAGRFKRGFVVADHDANGTGERAARLTGHPYWLAPAAGEDFNDFQHRVGLFSSAQSLQPHLARLASGTASQSA